MAFKVIVSEITEYVVNSLTPDESIYTVRIYEWDESITSRVRRTTYTAEEIK